MSYNNTLWYSIGQPEAPRRLRVGQVLGHDLAWVGRDDTRVVLHNILHYTILHYYTRLYSTLLYYNILVHMGI